MRLSIIIPAYNEETFLADCLRAALAEVGANSSEGPFEIVVVNNASTDKTAKIAESFYDVRVVHEPRKGLTLAKQRGLEEARGDILAFIDADTRMPRGWLGRVLRSFESEGRIVCVSGPYVYYDLPRFKATLVRLYWLLIARPAYRWIRYMAVGGNFAASKDALVKIGGFNTTISFYGEDTDIARRLSQVGEVVFDIDLVMQTSARRLHAEGFVMTSARYVGNFVAEVILKRPLTSLHHDIR